MPQPRHIARIHRVAASYLAGSRLISAAQTRGLSASEATDLFQRTAGGLTDVSKLRFQSVFMMGAGGSGKSYQAYRWMKYMPGGPPGGVTRAMLDKIDKSKGTSGGLDISEQERSLSNLKFENSLARFRKEHPDIDIELADNGKGQIPFRLYYEDPVRGTILLKPDQWQQMLPPEVYESVTENVDEITDIVFSAPTHELPNYWRQVNPDLYKEELAGYKAEQPGFVHEMSSDMSKAYFWTILETGDPLFVDGTGSNPDKMTTWMKAAKEAGYNISLVYVNVPLTVAQIRNAVRKRNVGAQKILEQFEAIPKSFKAIKGLADKVKVVDASNDALDLGNYRKNHEQIDGHVESTSSYPNLYELVKANSPAELSRYGKMLREFGDWAEGHDKSKMVKKQTDVLRTIMDAKRAGFTVKQAKRGGKTDWSKKVEFFNKAGDLYLTYLQDANPPWTLAGDRSYKVTGTAHARKLMGLR